MKIARYIIFSFIFFIMYCSGSETRRIIVYSGPGVSDKSLERVSQNFELPRFEFFSPRNSYWNVSHVNQYDSHFSRAVVRVPREKIISNIGAPSFGTPSEQTVRSLQLLEIPNHVVETVSHYSIIHDPWEEGTSLLVIPGAADVPYAFALK